jgi:hypothetical protein
MPRNALHIVSLILFIAGVVLFFGGLSFYFMDFPPRPDPGTGRTYELNNHGYVKYLTRREWLVHNGSMVIGLLSIGSAYVLEKQARRRKRR